MSQVNQVLAEAYSILAESPRRWIKGASARGLFGFRTLPESPRATCWCALGAITKACANVSVELDGAAKNHFRKALKIGSIPYWNDAPERTYEEVVAGLKLAAETPHTGE